MFRVFHLSCLFLCGQHDVEMYVGCKNLKKNLRLFIRTQTSTSRLQTILANNDWNCNAGLKSFTNTALVS